jgi:hypothetical protein
MMVTCTVRDFWALAATVFIILIGKSIAAYREFTLMPKWNIFSVMVPMKLSWGEREIAAAMVGWLTRKFINADSEHE